MQNNDMSYFIWGKYLDDDETLVWSGEPCSNSGLTTANIRAFVFSTIYMAIIGMLTALLYYSAGEEQRWGIAVCGVFIAAGLYLIINTAIAMLSGNNCIYAVTDKHILSYDEKKEKLKSAKLTEFNRMYVKSDSEGNGSIRFVNYKSGTADEGAYADLFISFDNIEEVCEVENIISRVKSFKTIAESKADIHPQKIDNIHDNIEERVKNRVYETLEDDESVIWIGKANTGEGKLPNLLRKRDYFRMVFTFVLSGTLAFAIILVSNMIERDVKTVPFVFGLPLVASILLMGLDPLLGKQMRLDKTTYILTDKRVLIMYDKQITSHYISENTTISVNDFSVSVRYGGTASNSDGLILVNVFDAERVASTVNLLAETKKSSAAAG